MVWICFMNPFGLVLVFAVSHAVQSSPGPRPCDLVPPPTAAERTREPVGPFRVYLQYSWSPGLACSRAFGDKMAVEVGVTHKPDVTLHTLTPEDRYLIVASDGVWELISSQVRKGLIKRFWCCCGCVNGVFQCQKYSITHHAHQLATSWDATLSSCLCLWQHC